MPNYKKLAFIIFIIIVSILLSSCSPYIPHVKDLTKSDTNETFLSNLEFHIDSTFETWKISGVMQDDKSNLYQYFLYIYKITVDSNNFWIFDAGIYTDKDNKKYFYELTSIDPFNVLKVKKNFIQLGKSYLKWNDNYLELRFKSNNIDFKISSILNNKIKNFQILPGFSDFSKDNIYYISRDFTSNGNLFLKDDKFKINSSVKGKTFVYRYFGKTFPDKLEMFFIPLKDKTYIIASNPKNNIIDGYLINQKSFEKIKNVSYTYSEVFPNKNRRYGLNWYIILDKISFNLIPLKKESIYTTFFEDFWSNIVLINDGVNKNTLGYGITTIDEFSRIIGY